jgi:hypothetical protein
MAKTYVVRAGQRVSIHCPFLYHGENFHTIDATSRARLIRFLDQVGDELSCKPLGAGSR